MSEESRAVVGLVEQHVDALADDVDVHDGGQHGLVELAHQLCSGGGSWAGRVVPERHGNVVRDSPSRHAGVGQDHHLLDHDLPHGFAVVFDLPKPPFFGRDPAVVEVVERHRPALAPLLQEPYGQIDRRPDDADDDASRFIRWDKARIERLGDHPVGELRLADEPRTVDRERGLAEILGHVDFDGERASWSMRPERQLVLGQFPWQHGTVAASEVLGGDHRPRTDVVLAADGHGPRHVGDRDKDGPSRSGLLHPDRVVDVACRGVVDREAAHLLGAHRVPRT